MLERITAAVWCAVLIAGALNVPPIAMAQEKIAFSPIDAEVGGAVQKPVTGVLFRPNTADRVPAVVALHGCGGLYQDGRIKEHYASWGGLIAEAGHALLLVDSHGSRGHGSLCAIPLEQRAVRADREMPRDAYGALRYLQSRPDVRGDRIGILGWSFGGQALLWTVAEGFSARPRDLPSGDFRAAIAFYPNCYLVNQTRSWSTKIPLLVLMGDIDNFTPPKPCVELLDRTRKAGAQVEIQLFANSHHAFDAPNEPVRELTNIRLRNGTSPTIGTNAETRALAIQRTRDFLAQHLK